MFLNFYFDYLCPGILEIDCPITGSLFLEERIEEKGGV